VSGKFAQPLRKLESDVLQMFATDVSRGMRRAMRGDEQRKPKTSVSIRCPRTIFEQVIWSKLPNHGQQRSAGERKARTYAGSLYSLEEVAQLVGLNTCRRLFSKGSAAFVCPTAVVVGSCTALF
jgi:hypothetical protein